MEYTDKENLIEKDTSRSTGVSAFIKEALEQIPEGQGLAMKDLATEIASNFNLPRVQAYVRIGNVLKRKSHSHFVKLQDEKGLTFISRGVVTEDESESAVS